MKVGSAHRVETIYRQRSPGCASRTSRTRRSRCRGAPGLIYFQVDRDSEPEEWRQVVESLVAGDPRQRPSSSATSRASASSAMLTAGNRTITMEFTLYVVKQARNDIEVSCGNKSPTSLPDDHLGAAAAAAAGEGRGARPGDGAARLLRLLNTPSRCSSADFAGDPGPARVPRHPLRPDLLARRAVHPGLALGRAVERLQARRLIYGENHRAATSSGSRPSRRRPASDALEVFFLCVMLGFRGNLPDPPETIQSWQHAMEEQVLAAQAPHWPDEPAVLKPEAPPHRAAPAIGCGRWPLWSSASWPWRTPAVYLIVNRLGSK